MFEGGLPLYLIIVILLLMYILLLKISDLINEIDEENETDRPCVDEERKEGL